ncbi:MAG: sigma-70 family RNA polymerase sigma factor [Actinomycetota bacterium]
MTDPRTDRELVLAYQAGDPRAFEEIDRRFRPLVTHICKRILGRGPDIEDAVQEVMLRVVRGLPVFNGQYQLKGWITTIASNHCLDVLRKRSRRAHIEMVPLDDMPSIPADEQPTPLDIISIAEEGQDLRAALEEIPSTHAEALKMRAVLGSSHAEIAERMGITPKKAKALLHRARSSLKTVWLTKLGLALTFLRKLVVRTPDHVERVASSAGSSAIGAAMPTVVSVASDPGTTQVISERIVAGVAAVAVAIGGTSAVVTTTTPKRPEARPLVAEASTTPSPDPGPTGTPEPVAPPPTLESSPSGSSGADPQETGPEASSEPSTAPPPSGEAPRTSPSQEPSKTGPTRESSPTAPEPSPSSSTKASPTASPEPRPAPPLTGSFMTSTTSDERCGCSGGFADRGGSSRGHVDEGLDFRKMMEGGAQSSSGVSWSAYVDISGYLSGSKGTLTSKFWLGNGSQGADYQASGTLIRREGSKGSLSTIFRGSYREIGDSGYHPIPADGVFEVELFWWEDGRTPHHIEIRLS